MPTISGFITVSDLVDGLTGATIVGSNELHTFVADADGAVSSTEAATFSNSFIVYTGSQSHSYVSGAAPGSNQFSITSTAVSSQTYRLVTTTVSPSGVDIEMRVSAAGVITIQDANSSGVAGFFDAGGANSFTATVSVVVDVGGTDVTYTKTLSFSKAIGGSSPYIRMTATRQTVAYDFGATSPKAGEGNFIITANSFNVSGSPTGVWSYALNGSATFTTLNTNQSGHTQAGVSTDTSTLTVTPAGYNTLLSTNDVITYRFTRDSQIDQISVYKLEDAEGGYNVVIEVIAGATVLKNNPTYNSSDATTYTDLRARIYRSGTEITSGLTYVWSKNGTAIPASGTGSLQITQPSNYGRTNDRIRVGGADVQDNGADVFSCAVTF